MIEKQSHRLGNWRWCPPGRVQELGARDSSRGWPPPPPFPEMGEFHHPKPLETLGTPFLGAKVASYEPAERQALAGPDPLGQSWPHLRLTQAALAEGERPRQTCSNAPRGSALLNFLRPGCGMVT